MSETLKFRVWHEMCHNFSYFKLEDGSHLHIHGEPEQFTGLLDRNGKEIYAGDVIKMPPELCHEQDETIGVVEFGYGRFFVKDKQFVDGTIHVVDFYDFNDPEVEFEVIGNVHEPPKDFRPEHLKRMGVSISKGGEE